MTTRPDWTLYLVTDRPLCGGRPLEEVVMAAVSGGVTAVQLREKLADTRVFVELARALKARLAPLGVPLLINDRVDVALAAGADGVHVGQSDMEYADVRRLLGPDAIIGLSVENMAHVRAADGLDGVDYLGIGPVFPTATKADAAPAIGLKGLAEARSLSGVPLVAIGGIDLSNAAEVMRAGVDGVAVVSAICAAKDPQAEATRLLEALT